MPIAASGGFSMSTVFRHSLTTYPRCDRRLVYSAMWFFLFATGCDQSPLGRPSDPAEKSSDKELHLISPGVGSSRIYIGLPEEDMLKWKQPTRVSVFKNFKKEKGKYLQYKDDGMTLSCIGGKVHGIFYYFLYKDYQPFHGETVNGIGNESSIKDVICTLGQPATISNVIVAAIDGEEVEWAGAQRVTLDYSEKGIRFEFLNNHLSLITIETPRNDLDPYWHHDHGDVSEFRRIDCADSKQSGGGKGDRNPILRLLTPRPHLTGANNWRKRLRERDFTP